jgi:hypothetical protein
MLVCARDSPRTRWNSAPKGHMGVASVALDCFTQEPVSRLPVAYVLVVSEVEPMGAPEYGNRNS